MSSDQDLNICFLSGLVWVLIGSAAVNSISCIVSSITIGFSSADKQAAPVPASTKVTNRVVPTYRRSPPYPMLI